jgi:negative regulator of sigma E activity
MISEELRELLSAAIDGELAPSERKTVKRLLRESEEARILYAQLKSVSQSLRKLPVIRPSPDFASEIVHLIDENGLTPTPLPPERHWSHRSKFWNPSMWATFSAAASVLFAVTMGSYLFFSSENQTAPPNRELAQKLHTTSGSSSEALPQPVEVVHQAPELAPHPREFSSVAKQENPEELPRPRINNPEESALTNPVSSLPLETFDVMRVRLSFVLPLHELDQAYPKEKLRAELRKDQIARLDLFCKDSAKAFGVIQRALKSRGHEVMIDSFLVDRIRKKTVSEIVLYTESFTSNEIAQFLESLGADDKKLDEKSRGSGHFDRFVLAPFVTADLDKLARLMGVTTQTLKLQPQKMTGLDLRKSIEETTGVQLVENLTKSQNSTSSKVDKWSLVLSYSPANPNPQSSKEIKAFLDKRGDRKSETKPLMLVLRVLN